MSSCARRWRRQLGDNLARDLLLAGVDYPVLASTRIGAGPRLNWRGLSYSAFRLPMKNATMPDEMVSLETQQVRVALR